MSTDMLILTIATIVLAIGSGVCGLLLTILLGLGGWTLISVVKFGNRLSTMEQIIRDLPCSSCRYRIGNGKNKIKP